MALRVGVYCRARRIVSVRAVARCTCRALLFAHLPALPHCAR